MKGLSSGKIFVSRLSRSSSRLLSGSKVFLVSLPDTRAARTKITRDIKMSRGRTLVKAPIKLSISLEILIMLPSSSLRLT